MPKNLIVAFPTTYGGFPKLCATGAMAGKYETTVVGNIVGDQPIAGQIQVAARYGLEGSQGYIASITDGVIQIAGGPKVRINDPDGAYAPAVKSEPQFIIDTENPTVSSFSGFPMCIPHSGNSATCSDSNRLAGQSNFNAPDPLAMVPLKVGDYIEYSGLLKGDEILAHSVVCVNVQVTTQASDTVPNYIRVEEMLVGVADTAGNIEVAPMRTVGYLSSCAGATVTLSAIDVDPCTGVETLRRIDSTTPKQETRCKWEIRTATKSPFTRDYMVTTNFPTQDTKNGIKAGQYVTAVGEWIFPEVNVPGTFPPPLKFTDIQSLVEGDVFDDQQFGQLDPFPGTKPSAPKKQCSPADLAVNQPTPTPTPSAAAVDPTVNDPAATGAPPSSNVPAQDLPVAAAVQFTAAQRAGGTLSLTGSNTQTKYTNDQLNFAWTQTSPSSPAISITNPTQATATFTAPKITAEQVFNFTLTVSLKSDANAKSTIVVPVTINPNAPDIVTMDTYTWASKGSGTIGVTCSSNLRNGDSKGMKVNLLAANGNTVVGTPLTMGLSGGAGRWAVNRDKTNRPANLQCVSDFGGKSAVRAGTATTSRRRKRYESRVL